MFIHVPYCDSITYSNTRMIYVCGDHEIMAKRVVYISYVVVISFDIIAYLLCFVVIDLM